MYKLACILLIIFKIIALMLPLFCIEVLIKEGINTFKDKLVVFSLVVVFVTFLYFIPFA